MHHQPRQSRGFLPLAAAPSALLPLLTSGTAHDKKYVLRLPQGAGALLCLAPDLSALLVFSQSNLVTPA